MTRMKDDGVVSVLIFPMKDIATLATQNEFEIFLPLFTASEANGGVKKSITCKRTGKTRYKNEHWSEKYKRHKKQKAVVALAMNHMKGKLSLPCKITLTRYASRKLDKFDNLPMSLKYILDSICEIVTGDYVPGRADSHEGFDVQYEQVNSKDYGVLINIKML
jgi:hypothetical protein